MKFNDHFVQWSGTLRANLERGHYMNNIGGIFFIMTNCSGEDIVWLVLAIATILFKRAELLGQFW